MNKKVLLSGCSFSDFSGWGEPGNKTDPRCWYNIVAKENQFDLTNVSYGGKSNREIIHAALEAFFCAEQHYDIIMVQLTSTGRNWLFNTLDAHHFYMANGSSQCNFKDQDEFNALELIRKRFNNQYREIERDLVNLVALHKIAENLNVRLILLNFLNFAEAVRTVEDDQLNDVIFGPFSKSVGSKIKSLYNQLEYSHKLGFEKQLFGVPYVVDRADDKIHAGEKTNKRFADLVNELLRGIND